MADTTGSNAPPPPQDPAGAAPAAQGGGGRAAMLIGAALVLGACCLCSGVGIAVSMFRGGGSSAEEVERRPPMDEKPLSEVIQKFIKHAVDTKIADADRDQGYDHLTASGKKASALCGEGWKELKATLETGAPSGIAVDVLSDAHQAVAERALAKITEFAATITDETDRKRALEYHQGCWTYYDRGKLSTLLHGPLIRAGTLKARLVVEQLGESTMIRVRNENCYDWILYSIQVQPDSIYDMVIPTPCVVRAGGSLMFSNDVFLEYHGRPLPAGVEPLLTKRGRVKTGLGEVEAYVEAE